MKYILVSTDLPLSTGTFRFVQFAPTPGARDFAYTTDITKACLVDTITKDSFLDFNKRVKGSGSAYECNELTENTINEIISIIKAEHATKVATQISKHTNANSTMIQRVTAAQAHMQAYKLHMIARDTVADIAKGAGHFGYAHNHLMKSKAYSSGKLPQQTFSDLEAGDLFDIPTESSNKTQLYYSDCVKVNDTQYKDRNGIIRTAEDVDICVFEVNTKKEYNRYRPDRIVIPPKTIEEETKLVKDFLAQYSPAELTARHKNIQEYMESTRFTDELPVAQESLRATEFILFTAKNAALSNQRTQENNPEAELRKMWTAQGVSEERQNELIASVTAKAQPGAKIGPFTIPEHSVTNKTTSGKTQSDLEKALIAAIKAYGRTWRKDIAMAWSTGNYGPLKDDWNAVAELQTARNTLGHKWLAKVKDPRGREL